MKKVTLVIFATFFAVYCITASGGYEVSDAVFRYETAKSWVDGRGGALAVADPSKGPFATGRDGRTYAVFGPLQSILMLPTVVLAKKIARGSVDTATKVMFEIVVTPFISAASIVVIFLALIHFGYPRRAGFWTVVVLGLATPLWHYSRSGQEENIIAFAFGCYLLGIARLWRQHFDGLVALAATACIILTTRMAYVPVLPILSIPVITELWRRRDKWHEWVKVAGGSAVIVIGTVGAILAYNYHRFARPFETGYGLYFEHHELSPFVLADMPENIVALLVSPFRGILWFCPAVVILVGLRRSGAANRLWPVVAGAWATTLVFIASYHFWFAGFAWGPRYLVALIALLAPFYAAIFASGQRWRIVTCASFVVQVLSVILPSATENYVYAKNLGGGCSPWTCRCTALCLRAPRALHAVINTLLGRSLPAWADTTGGPWLDYNESSDYDTVYWWPVRLAYRERTVRPAFALGICVTILFLAGIVIYQVDRSLAKDSSAARPEDEGGGCGRR